MDTSPFHNHQAMKRLMQPGRGERDNANSDSTNNDDRNRQEQERPTGADRAQEEWSEREGKKKASRV
jgi:hypothetical protein